MPQLLAPAPGTTDDVAVELHRRLALHLRTRLTPLVDGEQDHGDPADADDLRRFLCSEEEVAAGQCSDVPSDPDGFVAWFNALESAGPGQGDPLFPWLAEEADRASLLWFLRQELAGEAGADDLVALTLVRLPPRPKMELARNLWDEFGRGNPAGVRSMLLRHAAEALGIACPLQEATAEALALANLMAGLAVERHVYHAVGALGAGWLTAPGRVTCIARAMRRLDLPLSARRYYEQHAAPDAEHARRWNDEVLRPLVAEDPRCVPLLAQGAMMRLEAGLRCCERYRAVLIGG